MVGLLLRDVEVGGINGGADDKVGDGFQNRFGFVLPPGEVHQGRAVHGVGGGAVAAVGIGIPVVGHALGPQDVPALEAGGGFGIERLEVRGYGLACDLFVMDEGTTGAGWRVEGALRLQLFGVGAADRDVVVEGVELAVLLSGIEHGLLVGVQVLADVEQVGGAHHFGAHAVDLDQEALAVGHLVAQLLGDRGEILLGVAVQDNLQGPFATVFGGLDPDADLGLDILGIAEGGGDQAGVEIAQLDPAGLFGHMGGKHQVAEYGAFLDVVTPAQFQPVAVPECFKRFFYVLVVAGERHGVGGNEGGRDVDEEGGQGVGLVEPVRHDDLLLVGGDEQLAGGGAVQQPPAVVVIQGDGGGLEAFGHGCGQGGLEALVHGGGEFFFDFFIDVEEAVEQFHVVLLES